MAVLLLLLPCFLRLSPRFLLLFLAFLICTLLLFRLRNAVRVSRHWGSAVGHGASESIRDAVLRHHSLAMEHGRVRHGWHAPVNWRKVSTGCAWVWTLYNASCNAVREAAHDTLDAVRCRISRLNRGDGGGMSGRWIDWRSCSSTHNVVLYTRDGRARCCLKRGPICAVHCWGALWLCGWDARVLRLCLHITSARIEVSPFRVFHSCVGGGRSRRRRRRFCGLKGRPIIISRTKRPWFAISASLSRSNGFSNRSMRHGQICVRCSALLTAARNHGVECAPLGITRANIRNALSRYRHGRLRLRCRLKRCPILIRSIRNNCPGLLSSGRWHRWSNRSLRADHVATTRHHGIECTPLGIA